MPTPFDGLSKQDLKSALLNRLNELANLRSESKHIRARLSTIRSSLQAVQYEITQIQHVLSIENLVAMPQAQPEPQRKRKIGRWGKVTWELETSPLQDSQTESPVRESQRKVG